MCGFAGMVDLAGAPVDERVVRRMTRTLAHRGPDDEGYHFAPGIGLGHRRLSILDLSPSGRQPMANEDGTVWVAFNGELYNFRELRRDLERHGHRFGSESDTEVLVHGYEQWGDGCWERLDGFFALALWSATERRLVLARDPFGVKPLFYTVQDGRIIFGSELKALLASGLVERAVDLQSLSHFLSYAYTPGPAAILRNVRHVSPAETIAFEPGAQRSRRFWRLPLDRPFDASRETEIYEQLREECRVAVEKSLVSDVPVGLLLSGGIDSNIILNELLALKYPDVQSITVGFRQDTFDEASIAERRLRELGLNGHVTFVEDHDVQSIFDRMIYHVDCLNANVASLAEYYIFEVAARKLKVALAGMGNDELFAGYPTYVADRLRPYYRMLPGFVRRAARASAARLPPSGRKYGFDYLARKFTEGAEYDPLKSHYWWRTFFTPEEKRALIRPEAAASIDLDGYAPYERAYAEAGDTSREEQILYGDLQMFCIENANILLDNLSMAFSVEVRPPFLTKRFVEFAFRVPYRLKLRGRTTKYALREAYRNRLPSHVVDLRKSGLVSPISQLLQGPLREMMEGSLAAAAATHPYLDDGYCRALWRDHLGGRRDNSLVLYALLTYFRWYDRFIAAPAAEAATS